mmetsp:Transcript_75223/g.213934  ORF Transcript_75223/g.213934 Transcript_75223/m.213934 type:complete len:274 (-) Transcript_75223:1449-2270(-)
MGRGWRWAMSELRCHRRSAPVPRLSGRLCLILNAALRAYDAHSAFNDAHCCLQVRELFTGARQAEMHVGRSDLKRTAGDRCQADEAGGGVRVERLEERDELQVRLRLAWHPRQRGKVAPHIESGLRLCRNSAQAKFSRNLLESADHEGGAGLIVTPDLIHLPGVGAQEVEAALQARLRNCGRVASAHELNFGELGDGGCIRRGDPRGAGTRHRSEPFGARAYEEDAVAKASAGKGEQRGRRRRFGSDAHVDLVEDNTEASCGVMRVPLLPQRV